MRTHPDYPARYGLNYKNLLDHFKYYSKCPVFIHQDVIDNMQLDVDSTKRWADCGSVSKSEMLGRLTYIGSTNNKLQLFSSANIEFDEDNYPINPVKKTGLRGRGILGRWGSNHAADPIIAYQDKDGELWAIVVRRKDTDQYAIPGGMVDPGSNVSKTLVKELSEEAVDIDENYLTKLFETGIILYTGYVENDPRNTDNAWMETCVCGVLISEKEKIICISNRKRRYCKKLTFVLFLI